MKDGWRRTFTRVLSGLVVLGTSQFSGAVPRTPQAVIEKIFSQLQEPKVAREAKLQAAVNRHIDFSQLASDVLLKVRPPLSSSQRSWFTQTLRQIIIKTVYPEAPEFLRRVKISYEEAKTQKGAAYVLSIVKSKGEETEVGYRLRQIKGRWRVVDISIDDESWVESIREEVQDVLEREKWGGLKKRMNQRLNKLLEQSSK